MARKFDGGKLVIATHNSGKVVEIADLLAPFGADLVSAGELGLQSQRRQVRHSSQMRS